MAARARARQLEHQSDEVFFPHVIRLFGLQHDMQSEPARARLRRLRALLRATWNGCWPMRDYLAGPYSFADIAFYMAQVFADRKGAGMTEATPRLLAWRDRVGARPAVREVVGPMMRLPCLAGTPGARLPPALHLSA